MLSALHSCVNVGYPASILYLAKQKSFTSDKLKSQPRTSFEFECCPSKIEVVPSYKYLGIWLDKNLDYQNCATALA